MTTDDHIAQRRAELEAQLAAIPADDQLPATATRDDLLRQQQQRAIVTRLIDVLDAAVTTWRQVGSATVDEDWRDHLVEWRAILCTERLQIKSPIRDPMVKAREQSLALSIRAIDRGLSVFTDTGYGLVNTRLGELMRDTGYAFVSAPDLTRNFVGELPWLGSLPEVEKRLATTTEQRARAEAALADALLSDAERQQREADAAQLREAFNSLRVKHGPDATEPCLIAYRDGEVLSLDQMTPLQRTAFTKADAAFRAAQRRPVLSEDRG